MQNPQHSFSPLNNKSSSSKFSLCGAMLCMFGLAAQAAPPELAVSGNKIVVKGTTNAVRLVGVNIPSLGWGPGESSLMPSVDVAFKEWKCNIIRLPLSRTRFIIGSAYVDAVDTIIQKAFDANAYVILDLHSEDYPNNACLTFWNIVANRYKTNQAVLFGLFNEPHNMGGWGNWLEGKDGNPGMKDLLEAVRNTGAKNIVLVGGGEYAYDLSGILEGFALSDPTGNGVVYDCHLYPWKSQWQSRVANVAQVHPVLFGELGHPGGRNFEDHPTFEHHSTWVPKALNWIDAHNYHWTGWCMHPTSAPAMISEAVHFTPTSFWGAAALERLHAYQNPSAQIVVGGTVIGSPGTSSDPTSPLITDYSKGAVVAFDEGNGYYFDAASPSGGWTGLDLGTARRITRIDYVPRNGYGVRMSQGKFQGSNSANFSTFVNLHTINTTPIADGSTVTTVKISDTGTYRYVRYLGPTNSYCNVSSILFYSGDGVGATTPGTDVIVENETVNVGVNITGSWSTGSGGGYIHDGKALKGSKSVRFTPNLAAYGQYKVYARWNAHDNRDKEVPYEIAHATGADTVEVDQEKYGNQWRPLGTYFFLPGTSSNVLVSNAETTDYVVADAVRFVKETTVVMDNTDPSGVVITGEWKVGSGAGFGTGNYIHDDGEGAKSVAYTPHLTQSGMYDVYVWFTSGNNRATNTAYVVRHAGGSETARRSQQSNGGDWYKIGSWMFNAGTSGSVTISNADTNGIVVADGVKFVPQ